MKYALIINIALFAVLGLGSCNADSNEPMVEEGEQAATNLDAYDLTTKQFESSMMDLGKLEQVEFFEVVNANGMIDVPPANRSEISSYFGGTVKTVELLPGEKVNKGQLLFTLESPEYIEIQQAYLEAKGQLKYLQSDFERQQNLAEDQVSSQKNYLKAESEYTVTKVKLESLSKKLALMNINPETLSIEGMQSSIAVYSPINGYITEMSISRGTYLQPSQRGMTIVDTDHLHLELSIFEKDLSRVRVDQAIAFRIQNDQEKTYHAYVHLVNKSIDEERRTIGVHGHLSDENDRHKFAPGMYIEAEILSTAELKWALPEAAVVEVDGETYVLTLQNSSNEGYAFVKRKVLTGASNGGKIEILNAEEFEETTEFLTKGAFNLISL